MKHDNQKMSVSIIALAVRGALAAMVIVPMVAMAEGDDDVSVLTRPTNTVAVGVGGVSSSSNKFGEYNGLRENGAYFVGNLNIQGGNSYGQDPGTMRWSVTADDLGTTSREFGATVSDQGKWSIGIGYDELRHYTTTNYQTPYNGNMGGNTFTLPANFGTINTGKSVTGTSGGNTLVGGRSLSATQLGDFSTQDVYTQRENTKFNLGYDLDTHWNFRFDFNHLDQSGAKLIGSGTDPGGAKTGAFAGVSTWKGEVPVILMNPTNYTTDTFTASANWTGERSYATVGYYGSLFHDDYSGVSWANPFQTTGNTGTFPGTTATSGLPMSTMSTPPSNQFHQLNLTGGYNLSQATKLVGGLSYARNTQNNSFNGTYQPGYAINLPSNSLDGAVVMIHADARLTNRTTKNLTLSASFKYNERDNQTASNLYTYYDEGNKFREAWSAPMSNRKTQGELAADYRITNAQKLHVAYEYEKIERWCDNSPSYGQIISALSAPGTTYSPANIAAAKAYYAGGTGCAQIPESTENKLQANYRMKATETLNLNAGLSYGNRAATVNQSFYNPMQSVTEGFENPGFVAFFEGSRKESLVKAGANWQAMERLSFGLSGKYRKDDYTDETYGVGKGTVSSINLDTTYAFSDKNTVSAFATWQWRERDLNTESGRIPVAGTATSGTWSNNLNDNDVTLGLNGKQQGLFGGRLDLREDLTYSFARTDYNTTVNYVTTGCSTVVASNTSNQACGNPGTISSDLVQLKLMGNYHLDKVSSILVGYMFQHLKSNDYYYNAYQYPNNFTSGLPTNQQSPNYSVNAAYVAYQYSFR